jgi:hypothetical protein
VCEACLRSVLDHRVARGCGRGRGLPTGRAPGRREAIGDQYHDITGAGRRLVRAARCRWLLTPR